MRNRLRSYRRRTESAVQRAWRRGLAARARDRTTESETRSCLVLAAYPDDETLACGATILRKTSRGTPVKVLIATDGRNANPSSHVLTPEQLGEIRREEAVEACAILGVRGDDLVQLAHAHLRSQDWLANVRGHVVDLLRDFGPDEVLVNSALDYHPDHRALNQLLRDLVRSGVYTGRVTEYPIWYLFDGPWPVDVATLESRPTSEGSETRPSGSTRAWQRAVWLPSPAFSASALIRWRAVLTLKRKNGRLLPTGRRSPT